MEKEVAKKMAELIGWQDSDAIFAPGISYLILTDLEDN